MRVLQSLSLLAAAAPVALAQSSTTMSSSSSGSSSGSSSSDSHSGTLETGRSTATSTSGSDTVTYTFASSLSISTITSGSVSIPTGSYQTYTQQITLTSSSMTAGNGSRNNTLLLSGTGTPTPKSSKTSSALPTNTQACNNYPELCNREYMNFTEVCAHNSAFVQPNNAASNQQYGIISQLNDGVRMIQGETHYYNNTIYSCHSSCSLLNAGPLVNELSTVAQWVAANPYDVVTILLVNSNFRNVTDYVQPIQDSGLMPYLYVPPKVPMHRGDWPTLSTMILSGKRVVIFMDYNANQTEIPYVLDEFSQMWETPYSPTDMSFPCTQQRPPGLNSVQQSIVPYLANHNLNVQLSFAGANLLIPNFADLAVVNSINGTNGSNGTAALGTMAQNCLDMWNRPPAWLLVDFYNYGNFNGSVFEVAAKMNGLNYSRPCCGMDTSLNSAASITSRPSTLAALVALAVAVVMLTS